MRAAAAEHSPPFAGDVEVWGAGAPWSTRRVRFWRTATTSGPRRDVSTPLRDSGGAVGVRDQRGRGRSGSCDSGTALVVPAGAGGVPLEAGVERSQQRRHGARYGERPRLGPDPVRFAGASIERHPGGSRVDPGDTGGRSAGGKVKFTGIDGVPSGQLGAHSRPPYSLARLRWRHQRRDGLRGRQWWRWRPGRGRGCGRNRVSRRGRGGGWRRDLRASCAWRERTEWRQRPRGWSPATGRMTGRNRRRGPR